MAVIEFIRNWLKEYPGLKGRLDVDFLDEEAETFSIDTIPCEEVIKRYTRGASLKQYQFAISSRRYYEQNIETNVENLKFFENLTNWIENKMYKRELPEMDSNRTALRIIVTSNAYPFIVSEDGKARYQIQLRLEYFNKGVFKR